MAATVIALTVEPHGSVLTEPCMACTRLCSLQGNDLGGEGGAALAEALRVNATITTIE